MALYHHDSRDYQTAASEAAAFARTKLEKLIETGRTRAGAVIEQIMSQQPQDHIVRGRALKFTPVGNGVEIGVESQRPVHDHALQQLCSRAGLPIAYARTLQEAGPWGTDLLARNLGDLYGHQAEGKRYLTRSVGGEVRGFLSDRYRRLDSRPIVESLARTCAEIGALPVEGYALETKVAMKAVLPHVFEPVPNEVMAFGIYWENSDFGDGAHSCRIFMLRLWCTNYAISDTALRQIHLGKRLDDSFQFSQRTYELDTQVAASAVSDLVSGLLGPAKVEEACAAIKEAHETKVSANQVESFLKKRLTKGDAKAVTEAFNSADVEAMPAGQNRWRLSNALSWVAGQTEDERKRLDLMKLAGEAMAA